MFRASFAVVGLGIVGAGAHAADSTWPVIIPAPNGEVILASEGEKRAYDEYRYSAARRVDNMLYLSGVVIGRRENEGKDVAAFKQQVRRGFERIKATLEASGADFSNGGHGKQFPRLAEPEFLRHGRRTLGHVLRRRGRLLQGAVSRMDGRGHARVARELRHHRGSARRAIAEVEITTRPARAVAVAAVFHARARSRASPAMLAHWD